MVEQGLIETAAASAGTFFFDAQLNPVVPEVGQWFCEFDQAPRRRASPVLQGRDSGVTL